MPGNIITINGVIEYYVGDSKMDRLIEYLDKYGTKQKEKPERELKEKKGVKKRG